MEPTLRPGDRLLVDPQAYRVAPPRPGELVVVVDPEAADRWLVKRVVGVGPGRFWRTSSGLRPYSGDVQPSDAVEEISLEAGAVWVEGDALGASRDSRSFGPVAAGTVVGRVYFRYRPVERRTAL